MADLIPFPRVMGRPEKRDPQALANAVGLVAEFMEPHRAGSDYLNRPCRSPAELEALLRASADTTAAKEGV